MAPSTVVVSIVGRTLNTPFGHSMLVVLVTFGILEILELGHEEFFLEGGKKMLLHCA